MAVKVIDLFSGAGGLSLGLRNSGMEICAAVEINHEAVLTYRQNFGEVVLEKDISEITGEELLEIVQINDDDILVLAGCPPCQGFSSIGLRDVNDVRNQLIFHYLRLIEETNPHFIIMENVPGMATGVGKRIFNEACDLLEEEYYIKHDILNAANYGVPQARKRLVLHGVRGDLKERYFPDDFEINMPVQTHSNNPGVDNLAPWVTVDIINDFPPIQAGESHDEYLNHECMRLLETNLERIQNTPHNGGSRTSWPDRLVLECHKEVGVGYKDVYGRMDSERVAPTITAGCLCYSKGRFGHPTQNRAISAREAAKLQTFEDDFIFLGSLGSISKQIGNAVPPALAEASGRYIMQLVISYIHM